MSKLGIAVIILATGVVLGAFGAHSLENHIEPNQLKAWNTAVQYQFIHGLGYLALCILYAQTDINKKLIVIAQKLMLAGIILFSGSIYFLATQNIIGANLSWLGPVTPIGGILFISSWVVLVFAAGKSK